MESVPYQKFQRDYQPLPTMWGHSKKVPTMNQERALPEGDHAPGSRNVSNKFVLFKSYPDSDFVIAANKE